MASLKTTESSGRKWRRLVVHETFEYFFNFMFLAIFLVAFAWYRRLILASYHIQYLGYWAPLIEAAILAKVVMLGDVLRIGRRLCSKPLIVSTVYRTIVFTLFVLLFSFVEHVTSAVIHGKSASFGVAEFTSKGWNELLAWCLLIMTAFLPFFAMKELERAFGTEKVRGVFFHGHSDSGATAD